MIERTAVAILRSLGARVNSVREGTYWGVFGVAMACYCASIVMSLDAQQEVFMRDAWQIPMFRALLFLGIYAPVVALNPRRRAGRDAVICMLTMMFFASVMEYEDDIRLNNALLAGMLPDWIDRVMLQLANPMWALALILLSLPILLVSNWFADRRMRGRAVREYGLNAILSNGIFVYFVLSLTIWVATHFTYVAGLSFYMRGYQRHIDQTTRVLDEVGRYERLPLKGLVHVASAEEVEARFLELRERTREDRRPMVIDAHTIWRQVREHGASYFGPEKGYTESKDFFEFVGVVFNHRFHGYRDGAFWFSRISSPADYDAEISKHFFVYVRPSQAGGYWTFMEFSRHFKERRHGAFLTQFYMLFLAVFPMLLTWLWLVHRRRLQPVLGPEGAND